MWNRAKTWLAFAIRLASSLLTYLTGIESFLKIIEQIAAAINRIRVIVAPVVIAFMSLIGKAP